MQRATLRLRPLKIGARVAGIDLAIRTVERTAGVEIDHGYGIEP